MLYQFATFLPAEQEKNMRSEIEILFRRLSSKHIFVSHHIFALLHIK